MVTNAQRLSQMRVQDPTARTVFDYLLSLGHDGEKPTQVALAAKSTALTEREVREVFRKLQGLRLGRLIVGRHGGRTRFEWAASIQQSIPARRKGEQDAETAALLELSYVNGVQAATTNAWVVKLGGRRTATLLLPISLTRAELEKVRDFCRALNDALPA